MWVGFFFFSTIGEKYEVYLLFRALFSFHFLNIHIALNAIVPKHFECMNFINPVIKFSSWINIENFRIRSFQ